VFVAAIALSAFLLFALELLAGRLVLPVFGGAPAVWTTTLCFFTAVVFVGYLYAHVVATRLSARVGMLLHVGVAVVALALALRAPSQLAALRMPGLPEALNVLAVLALIAGAPALLLAATTPLLSDWHARGGSAPWWLYAVSNGASLAGLLAYPLLIEPFVPLSAQRVAMGAALAVLVGLLAGVAGWGLWERLGASEGDAASASRAAADGAGGVTVAADDAPPAGLPADTAPAAAGQLTLRRQAIWLFAACIPAGLMSATTTHITTDHISAPLLWIGPLGVYLASFVVAFSSRGRRALPVAEWLAPAAATLMWVPFVARVDWPAWVLLPMLLASLGVLSVAIHGRLALDRPAEAHLTRFYLVLSAGGMIATAFVALVAPLIFDDVYEYPLLIVGALVALALLPGATAGSTAGRSPARTTLSRLGPFVVAAALVLLAVMLAAPGAAAFVGIVLFVGLLAIAVGRTPAWLAATTALAIVALMLAFTPATLVRVRTFFGVTQVRADRGGSAHTELHGTTLHGLQFLDARRAEPTSYYAQTGPLGDVFAELARRTPDGAHVGLTGLGVGTVAAFERPTDTMTYFEIDPAVVALAVDPRYFTYLADAPVQPFVIVGDGRLSLAQQPARSFDLLVLDAFSSDTVPTHLLTAEALRDYRRTLGPGGIMAFHLTNRHYDLAPAVAATARSIGLDARVRTYVPSAADSARIAALPSTWLVVGAPGDLAAFDSAGGWQKPADGPVLTDDYSSVMRLVRWR
jgi:hypothetical protein